MLLKIARSQEHCTFVIAWGLHSLKTKYGKVQTSQTKISIPYEKASVQIVGLPNDL